MPSLASRSPIDERTVQHRRRPKETKAEGIRFARRSPARLRCDCPLRVVELGDLLRLDDHTASAAAEYAKQKRDDDNPPAHRPASSLQPATVAPPRRSKPSSG